MRKEKLINNKSPVAEKISSRAHKVERVDSKTSVAEMASSNAYEAEKTDGKRLVTETASNGAHGTERADIKRPLAEIANSRRLYYFKRRLYKYEYGYVLPASTDLRENLYKRQIWQSQ